MRLIDLFVDSLALNDYGFKLDFVDNGRPAGLSYRRFAKLFILNRATADVGLLFTAYNLKRLFNILDKNTLKAYLKAICLLFPALFDLIRGRNRHFKTTNATIQNTYPQIRNLPKALLPSLFGTDFKNIHSFEMGFRQTDVIANGRTTTKKFIETFNEDIHHTYFVQYFM